MNISTSLAQQQQLNQWHVFGGGTIWSVSIAALKLQYDIVFSVTQLKSGLIIVMSKKYVRIEFFKIDRDLKLFFASLQL